MADQWIDISVPHHDGMVHWPDTPPVKIERRTDIDRSDTAIMSIMSRGVHTRTHADYSPRHFLRDRVGVQLAPFTALIGPARVIAIADPKSVNVDELRCHEIQSGERIFFKTRNSLRCWQADDFVEEFVYVSHAAARYLASRQVQTVGVDYLSVGGYTADGAETHPALLTARIWIIKGLNLSDVQPGTYELICLPLKIMEAMGRPRAQC